MAKSKKCVFSFDIGHSSIGWAVLSSDQRTKENPFPTPAMEGCGSVIFPKDDCLASARRDHRRTRRNIRSTRQRIARIRALLLHLGVLSEAKLDATGHPAPHFLAARALIAEAPTLSWIELWHILRWYAHNRGYDGNSRWSRQDSDAEDNTEKEKVALDLMAQYGTTTMAETICAALGLDLSRQKISSNKPFKTFNAAFPRHIVRNEVLALLEKHKDHLNGLDDKFIRTLVATPGTKGKQAWTTIPVPTIKLPRRYFGGLLFGQLIPRFDNRIITTCPISGNKTPNKKTREFLYYRWAMLLANIKADGKFLTAAQRQAVHTEMTQQGRLTPTELRKCVENLTGTQQTNISASFEIHPDSKEALILDPALAYFHSADITPKKNTTTLAHFWQYLPSISKYRALGRWKKRRLVTLQWMLDECTRENHNSAPLQNEIEQHFAIDQKKKKPRFLTKEHFLRRSFAPKALNGRAPYSRKTMQEVFSFVLSTDRHPTEAGTEDLPPGPIYRSSEVIKAERKRPIDDLTNNHLIRQRLTILSRLVDDILANYCNNDTSQVTDIVVEVARDLQAYSGMTAKEMAGELTKRLSHFTTAVKYLKKNAPDLNLTGSLIRKCRIAMDLEWRCPFTGKKYDAYTLPQLEREHIIPYSERPTNALDSLVLTYDWVNRLKGKRTALQFIKDVSDDDRFLSPGNYGKFVEKLKVSKRETYPDDYRRQTNRKKLMMVEQYQAKDHGFTQGALTQTSHLNRLSVRQLEKRFVHPDTGEPTVRITSIPGQITAATRKGWRLLHTLNIACPECSGKNKTEIRSITHLHHALDAASLAITHHYLPGNLPGQRENKKGAIWKALLDRNKTKEQISLLMSTGLFAKHYRRNSDGGYEFDKSGNKQLDVHLHDQTFPAGLKAQLSQRLAERRVVQHIPADRSGARLEETTWRYHGHMDGYAIITQAIARTGRKENTSTTSFGWGNHEFKKEAQKLLPQVRHLLNKQQINLIQRGLLKLTTEPSRSVIGMTNDGKLSQNKAVRVIGENFGIALGNKPQIIPFHSVSKRLRKIIQDNGGDIPSIIRIGTLIRVTKGTWKGTWVVTSTKDSKAYGLSADLAKPWLTKLGKGNAKIPNMLADGLEILSPPLIGLAPEA